MRITHLRQADLNLLVVFTALAEERNVSRAAQRLFLSQPAVTRAMHRLRDLFHDDLLVRVSGSYEITPKGERLLREVETVLPRLDRLLAGGDFNPAKEAVHFRIAGTDYAAHVIGIPLSKEFLAAGSNLSFALSPLRDEVFDAIDRGRIDLMLRGDDGLVPPRFPRQVIFEEEIVCVVSKDSHRGNKLTLRQYLDGLHVGVDTFGGTQSIPDQRLATGQRKRRIAFIVPFHNVAIEMVAGTNLIATMPRRMAMDHAQNPELKIMSAPKPLDAFSYLMVWHPRMDSDAAHIWLRHVIVKVAGTIKKNNFLNANRFEVK
jgi:DNA-binding transcriptional LysR family regulator